MIVIVDVEVGREIDALGAQPGSIVHASGVRFGGMADNQFSVIETEVGTKPLIEVIEVVHVGSGLRAGGVFAGLKMSLT